MGGGYYKINEDGEWEQTTFLVKQSVAIHNPLSTKSITLGASTEEDEDVFYYKVIIPKLNTIYGVKYPVFNAPSQTLETYEIQLGDDVDLTFTWEDGGEEKSETVTAKNGTVIFEDEEPYPVYVLEDNKSRNDVDLYNATSGTTNPNLIEHNSFFVRLVEEEVSAKPENNIISIDKYGIQSESLKLNDDNIVSLHDYDNTTKDVNFVDGGLYCVNGESEYLGRYEEGKEIKFGVINNGSKRDIYDGTVLTNVETGLQVLNTHYILGDTKICLEILGTDEEDPTLYKLGNEVYLHEYGLNTLRLSKSPTIRFREIEPGVAYDQSKVHYNGREFNFSTSGVSSSNNVFLSWDEIGFTQDDFDRLMSLYEKGNVCGYDFGISLDGKWSTVRGANNYIFPDGYVPYRRPYPDIELDGNEPYGQICFLFHLNDDYWYVLFSNTGMTVTIGMCYFQIPV